MSVELATAYIALVPSMKGASASIAQEMTGIGTVAGESSSRGFLSSVGGVTGKVVGITAGAVAAVGGLVGGLALKGGISRQLQIEDATAKLSGLGNSTKDVTTIMGDAMASVKGTAFGMGEAATVAAGAVAAGIKPGHDLERVLKLTGDSATIAGTSMGEMGGIFNKVASSGKVTGDVVAQLQDRGFPILQMLATKYGVTAEAASKMVSEGKVNFADFSSSIEANVGGAALKSGDTTKGAFANMGAALSRVGVTLSSGFFPLVKNVFNQVTLILDGVNAKVKPAAEAFGVWFQGKASPVIATFAKTTLARFMELRGGLMALVAAFQNADDGVTSSGFAGAMERVGIAARRVVDWIVPVAAEVRGGLMAFAAAFQNADDGVTSSGFAGTMERIAITARHAWDGAQPMFHAISQGWRDMMSSFQTGDFSGTGASLVSVFSALGPIMQPMGTILVAIGKNIGDFGTSLGELIAGALPLVIPILKTFTDGLKFLADHSEMIAPIVVGLGAAFLVYKAGQTAANVAELGALPIKAASVVANLALASSNNALADAKLLELGMEKQGMVARLPATAQVIAQTVAKVAGAVATGAVATATGVATAAQWLWNAALTANPIGIVVIAIAALVAGIVWAYNNVGWFKDGLNAAWAFISSVTMTVLGAVGSFFTGLWSGIVSFATGAVGGFIGFVTSGWSTISGVTTAVFSAVGSFLGGIWSGIVNGVSGMIGNVLAFFSGLPGKIMGFLAGAGGWLVNAGKDIINGLINGIGSMIGAIGNAILSLVPGPIVGVFKAALGIQSPSRVFHAFGGFIGEGLVNGLVASVPSIRSTSQKMAKEVIAAFDHHAITRGVENNLLSAIGRTNDSLVRLANQRGAVLSRLKNATTAYNDAVKVRNDYAGSIADSARSGVDASQSLNLVNSLSMQISKTKELTTTLASLKKLGLDSATYKQLADGGLDAIPAAEALLRTGKGGIAHVASLQKQLGGAAKALGSTAAENLYGAGVNAAHGLVNGLKSQSAAIGAQMTAIAKSMSSAIKHALGIRSPSTVFHGFGVNIMEGLLNGTDSLTDDLNAKMANLVKVPETPTGISPSLLGSNAAASRQAGVTIGTVHVRDEHEMARIITNKQRDAQLVYGF